MKYAASFGVGLALAAGILAVAAAVGYAEYAGAVDAVVAVLGLVFAFATGLNLGMWLAIKDVDGERAPADGGAALSVVSFSAALLLSGLVATLAT